jgi:hypothetical protein
MTALMYAAKNGQPRMIELLLKKGASPLVKDKTGATALALATRYAPEAETLKALKAGAKQSVARGNKQATAVPVSYNPARRGMAVRDAAEKAISLLEKTADNFSKNAGCISCHHQGLGLMATGLAKERGFRYDQVIADSELTRMRKEDESHGEQMKGVVGHPEMYKFVPAVDIAEFVPGASFMFQAYVSHNIPSNPGLQGMATILAAQQEEDGRWGFQLHREPMQWSEFTTTALTIRLLKAYFPKENAKELNERMAKARQWLITTEPKTNEDRTFRLLALAWADAPRAEIDKAMAGVKKLQRKDGGWAQYPDFRSDAYATGTTLYALHMAGMPAKDAAYRKGMDYLIRTQDPEGSWYVNKRGIAANTYFDSGFPHGESQYISYGATAWASMALMLGAEPAQRTASK